MTAKKVIWATIDVGLVVNALALDPYAWAETKVSQLDIDPNIVQGFMDAAPILAYVLIGLRVLVLLINDGEVIIKKVMKLIKYFSKKKKK